MMLLLALTLSLVAVYGANKIEMSWALCSGNDAKECDTQQYANITNETFIPNPPPFNQNFSIKGFGYSKEAITDPSYWMEVKDGVLFDDTIHGIYYI